MADFDLAIVGGGINGAGIARDAAGRGLRVLLVEQNDLASGTSSASTKLIHGGLRYLEQGWFRLVREALIEREVMLRMAPHLIRPMRFVLPAEPGLRPAWMLRLGLLVYDHLGGRKILPPTRTIALADDALGTPLKRRYERGFEYSDCWADDARLVVVSALDAAERGATIRTRTRCIRAERGAEWRLVLEVRGRRDLATARVLVNATGPWLKLFAQNVLRDTTPLPARLDEGSHIVVRRLFDHDRGYIVQTRDGRFVFALPFEQDFTLIGTTDRSLPAIRAASGRAPMTSPIFATSRTSTSAPPSVPPMWSGHSPGSARSMTTAPARPRTSPATISWTSTSATARRRCSRSMAARSRPIGGWRSRRSTVWRILLRAARPGPGTRICRAANSRTMVSRRW
jgi:glycerol-3-phosphate dehydrogenase